MQTALNELTEQDALEFLHRLLRRGRPADYALDCVRAALRPYDDLDIDEIVDERTDLDPYGAPLTLTAWAVEEALRAPVAEVTECHTPDCFNDAEHNELLICFDCWWAVTVGPLDYNNQI